MGNQYISSATIKFKMISDTIVEIKPSDDTFCVETKEQAHQNMTKLNSYIGDRTLGILVNLPNHHILPEARIVYRDEAIPVLCMALVAPTMLKRIIADLLLKTFQKKAPGPTRVFRSKAEAIEWIEFMIRENNQAA